MKGTLHQEMCNYCAANEVAYAFYADGSMRQIGGAFEFPREYEKLVRMSRPNLAQEIIRLRQIINRKL